jgi:hypothetical protein
MLCYENKKMKIEASNGDIKHEQIHVPYATTIQRTGFVLLGIVSLWPYNFLLECLGYFSFYFGPDFGSNSHIVYGVAANISQLLSLFLLGGSSKNTLITVACVLISFVSFEYGFVTLIADIPQLPLIGLSLALVLGFFNALIQSTGSSLCGRYPDCLTLFYLGQSLSGLFPWPITVMLNFVFRAFGLSPFRVGEEPSPMDKATACTSMVIGGLIPLLFLILFRVAFKEAKSVTYTVPPVMKTFKKSWPTVVLCWFIFVVSFVIYPRELLKWKPSTFESWYPRGEFFYVSFVVYIAIVFDTVGMYLGQYSFNAPLSVVKLVGYSRVVFIPLFALSSSQLGFLSTDLVQFSLVVCMSISGSLTLAWAMNYTQQMVPEEEGESIGAILSFALTNGIFVGSGIGSCIDSIIRSIRGQ